MKNHFTGHFFFGCLVGGICFWKPHRKHQEFFEKRLMK
ncbi:hypothetical protein BOVA172_2138 [Bacteroides ovatus]|nr:hypothetical protein BOVA172_2138 [Bacteroides ovatus]CAG9925590.1 hypothetical protein BOVA435_4178 [Bacteroides ovatus]